MPDAWIAVAISYPGLVALGVPEDSLRSFPEAFRMGMAGRADTLRDRGLNDPKSWDLPFGKGQIHIHQRLQRHRREVAAHHHHGSKQFEGRRTMLVLRTSAPSPAA